MSPMERQEKFRTPADLRWSGVTFNARLARRRSQDHHHPGGNQEQWVGGKQTDDPTTPEPSVMCRSRGPKKRESSRFPRIETPLRGSVTILHHLPKSRAVDQLIGSIGSPETVLESFREDFVLPSCASTRADRRGTRSCTSHHVMSQCLPQCHCFLLDLPVIASRTNSRPRGSALPPAAVVARPFEIALAASVAIRARPAATASLSDSLGSDRSTFGSLNVGTGAWTMQPTFGSLTWRTGIWTTAGTHRQVSSQALS